MNSDKTAKNAAANFTTNAADSAINANPLLDAMGTEMSKTLTENGAVTYSTTASDCLDFFANIGGMRNRSERDIVNAFELAYIENPDMAMKLLFYTRDIRGGLGERKIFRTIVKYLARAHKESLLKNLKYFSEFGRWDDLLVLIQDYSSARAKNAPAEDAAAKNADDDTDCAEAAIAILRDQLNKDVESLRSGEGVSLLGKWLPSVNASSAETRRQGKLLAKAFGLSEKEYRQTLTALRQKIKIMENFLREGTYEFDYSNVTSQAMLKYRQAFFRNDYDKYVAYLQAVAEGKTTVNTGTLTPCEIVNKVAKKLYEVGHYRYWFNYTDEAEDENPTAAIDQNERLALNTMWNSLEDFTDDRNALVVIDGSGSMYRDESPMPISVAMSLGIYFAERNKGAFADHFITFSANPKLIKIKGADIVDKVEYCMRYNEIANTNIERVFHLVLDAAVKNDLPQEELPETIYIVSDMEFDYCTQDASLTNFENAKNMFERAGYKLPNLVFWNVSSRNNQVPVRQHETGTALVSGYSARKFSYIVENVTPYEFMLEILSKERYEAIVA